MEPNAGHSARRSMYFCWAWEGVMPWNGERVDEIEGGGGKIILVMCCFGVNLATPHKIVQELACIFKLETKLPVL